MILVYHPGVTTTPESPFWSDDDPGDTTALGSPPPGDTVLRSPPFWGHYGFGVTMTLGTPPAPWGQPRPGVTAVRVPDRKSVV